MAEHFADGSQQVLADDAVLFRTDADRAVLGGDVLDGAQKHGGVFNVFGVGQNGAGQSLLLMPAFLVRVVERVLQFGVAREHALVEVRDQRNAVFTEHGNGGLDEFNLAGSQHSGGLS